MLQFIIRLRPEKTSEQADMSNIHVKVTCETYDELQDKVDDFIKSYNKHAGDQVQIFDWTIAKDDDLIATMMIQDE